MTLKKIVSGGQTGVDRAALDGALDAGFPYGGWCPAGRLAEDGPIPARYTLDEMPEAGYRERTLRNVTDSDATALIYFGEIEGGTEATLLYCIRHRKPYKLLDAETVDPERAGQILAAFVEAYGVEVLNVAGPRASKWPDAGSFTHRVVTRLLRSALIRDPSAAS